MTGKFPHLVHQRAVADGVVDRRLAQGMDADAAATQPVRIDARADNPRARLAAEILSSASYPGTGDRVRAFVEKGGGCRATFFNYRRRLESCG